MKRSIEPEYTAQQAAKLAKVSRPTITRAIMAGELKAGFYDTPFGQQWFCIKQSDLDAWMAHRKAEPKKLGRPPKRKG